MVAARAALLATLLLMVAVASLDPDPSIPGFDAKSAALRQGEPLPSQVPPGVGGDWLARVQRGVAELEYQASVSAAGLQAPNRAHNLRTYFEPTGIRVVDRTAEGSPQLLELRVNGWGRGERLVALGPGTMTSAGPRVEIRRADFVEWYENGAAGLEQGFTLSASPGGEGPVVVELTVGGAQVSEAGDGLSLTAPTGRRLGYGGLAVRDSLGKQLPARLELGDAGEFRIVVDDWDACYPVTVDPLLTASATLEGDQDGAALGISVAGAGDVNGDGYADVIVGAYQYDAGETNEGAALIFLGGPSGVASGGAGQAAAILQSNQAGADLGYSVAGAGDVNGDGYADVIVGAYEYDAGEIDEGAAFIFLGSALGVGSGTPATAATTLQSNQMEAYSCGSVAGAGDVNGDGYADVIVGATSYGDGGAAFIFLGGPSGVVSGSPATAATRLQSTQAGAYLGTSVASAGDVNGDGYDDVIVGAGYYSAGQDREGAAFVFLGSATGVASGNQTAAATTLESNQADAAFGLSVAGAGDVNGDGYADVIVGAPYYDPGVYLNAGIACLFRGGAGGVPSGNPGTAWAALPYPANNAFLGWSVAGAGDVNGDGYADVVVGYPGGHVEGGGFMFYLGGPSADLVRFDSFGFQQGAKRGYSVAGAGDVNGDGYSDVIVGAPYYDSGSSDEGVAVVYLGGRDEVAHHQASSAATTLQSDWSHALLGASVAGAGDVNGDGYADVLVGCPSFDWGEVDEGVIFVFLGSSGGVVGDSPATAATFLQSNQANSFFGHSLAGAGDVNGDGYADVMVGAPSYDAGQSDEGAAFVFLGGVTGIADGDPATAAATLQSDQAFSYLGWSVAGAGDVNGDGYADLIVGAIHYDVDRTDEGAAFVFLGSASGVSDGTPEVAATALRSNEDDVGLGYSVAGAGDVDGDGYADVIVGAHTFGSTTDDGAAFVVLGSASGVPGGIAAEVAATRLLPNQAGAGLGYSVGGAGDVNADGYADVIVGAPYYDAGARNEGAAFVFLGSAVPPYSGDPTTAVAVLQNFYNQEDALMGVSVAGAGDVNGDGYADVIVGAQRFDELQTNEGAAFVFLGGASGTSPVVDAWVASGQADAELGYSVAAAGDVNGDGYADVIVGAPSYDAGQIDEGAAFVFTGHGAPTGRPVLARQWRGDGSGIPVQAWGGSHLDGAFGLGMRATDPRGRGRVRLEVQCCPPGAAFGSAECSQWLSPSWQDVTATAQGVSIDLLVGGLASNTLYRWRARVQYAPYAVVEPGITPPPHPAHGPWRRLQGQAVDGDIRIGRVGVSVEQPLPVTPLAIERVWPNPATGAFSVRCSLPGRGPARLELFTVAGRRVLARELKPVSAGPQTVLLGEGRSLAAGIYLVRLSQGGESVSVRATILH